MKWDDLWLWKTDLRGAYQLLSWRPESARYFGMEVSAQTPAATTVADRRHVDRSSIAIGRPISLTDHDETRTGSKQPMHVRSKSYQRENKLTVALTSSVDRQWSAYVLAQLR